MNENVKVVFGLIGGLALFLYGMNSMSDAVVAETVFKNKKKMHKAEKKYSKAHLNRVKNEVCDASMTRYFSGIMYNFDRMADNCVSIAEEACDNVAFINLDEETGKSMMERGAV